jgi:hypothetical protein
MNEVNWADIIITKNITNSLKQQHVAQTQVQKIVDAGFHMVAKNVILKINIILLNLV